MTTMQSLVADKVKGAAFEIRLSNRWIPGRCLTFDPARPSCMRVGNPYKFCLIDEDIHATLCRVRGVAVRCAETGM